jgi:hypothetical protein
MCLNDGMAKLACHILFSAVATDCCDEAAQFNTLREPLDGTPDG